MSAVPLAYWLLFGIVSSLVGVARKRLEGKEAHKLDKDFQEVHDKLKSISAKNQKCLQKIRLGEVNETLGVYGEHIKHQYAAFNSMVTLVRRDPDNAQSHMEEFKQVYEQDESVESLDVFYRSVTETSSAFGRPFLKVYLEHCKYDRKVMEHRCSHLGHLFQISLVSLMAYTAVTEDDEDEVREKWSKRVEDIQRC